jgi:chromosome segregation ATPase
MSGTSEKLPLSGGLPDGVAEAVRRLFAALDRLDAARERRAEADRLRANLEEELAIMQDDRARLAVELDGAAARVKTLESANDEARRKLSHAMAEITAVLAKVAAREE